MGEERKLFKTKLCALYQKGHCPRDTCSFAHGHAELRRFSASSFFGRRDYRSGDLRDKLERRRSPLRRYSPRRNVRGRQESRGYSPKESDEKRSSERKPPKKQYFDGQSDRSGSVKVSDHTEDRSGKQKLISHELKSVAREQLRQAYAEIDDLNNRKSQLKSYLQDKIQEVDSLTSQIQEIENLVFQEKEEGKRITSKIKKFITAHKRHSRLQDELKRSNDQLQRMGDQLSSDTSRLGGNEDSSNINMLSDGETTANLMKGVKETVMVEKHSRWSSQHAQFNHNVADQMDNGSSDRTILNRSKSKRRKIHLPNAASEDKLKGRESGFNLPLSGMAAHAIEEGIETIDIEENPKVTETTFKRFDEGATNGIMSFRFPLPPPPPLPDNAYAQYQGEDENVDVDALEDNVAEVDII